jgi:hypothetical protein
LISEFAVPTSFISDWRCNLPPQVCESLGMSVEYPIASMSAASRAAGAGPSDFSARKSCRPTVVVYRFSSTGMFFWPDGGKWGEPVKGGGRGQTRRMSPPVRACRARLESQINSYFCQKMQSHFYFFMNNQCNSSWVRQMAGNMGYEV